MPVASRGIVSAAGRQRLICNSECFGSGVLRLVTEMQYYCSTRPGLLWVKKDRWILKIVIAYSEAGELSQSRLLALNKAVRLILAMEVFLT
jgi:hypothetical protein